MDYLAALELDCDQLRLARLRERRQSGAERRTAPAQTDTTTSLTVVPCAFLTSLNSSREREPKVKRRWGETRWLNDVLGAR